MLDLRYLVLLSSNDPPVPAFSSLFSLQDSKAMRLRTNGVRLLARSVFLIAPQVCREKAKRCPNRRSLSSCTLRQVLKAYAWVTELAYGAIDVYDQSRETHPQDHRRFPQTSSAAHANYIQACSGTLWKSACARFACARGKMNCLLLRSRALRQKHD